MLGLKIWKFYFGSPGQRPDSKRSRNNFEEIFKTVNVAWGDLGVVLYGFSLEEVSKKKYTTFKHTFCEKRQKAKLVKNVSEDGFSKFNLLSCSSILYLSDPVIKNMMFLPSPAENLRTKLVYIGLMG